MKIKHKNHGFFLSECSSTKQEVLLGNIKGTENTLNILQ